MTDWQSLLSPSVKTAERVKLKKLDSITKSPEKKPVLLPSYAELSKKKVVQKQTVNKFCTYSYDSDVDFQIPDRCVRGNCDNPKLIVVTESPTLVENYWNFAHCGDAGILLTQTLEDGGIDCGNFFNIFNDIRKYLSQKNVQYNSEIRNLIESEYQRGDVLFYHINNKDCVIKNSFGKEIVIKDISDEVYFKSLLNFHKLVNALKPEHIIVLGSKPFEKIIGKSNVASYAGITFDYEFPQFLKDCVTNGNQDPTLLEEFNKVDIHKCLVDVDLHPAFVIQNSSQAGSWRTRIKNVLKRLGKRQVTKPVKSTVFTDFQQAKDFLQSWIDDPTLTELSYDWETISLEACAYLEKSITVTINLARNPDEGYVVPTFHKDVDWTMDQRIEICGLIGKLLLKPRKVTYGHNLLFDNLVSRRDPYLGIGSKRIPGERIDTMIISYILDETGSHGLKELCNVYTDLKNYESELEDYKKSVHFTSKNNYGEIPLNILGKYGAYDAVANIRLYNALIPMIKNEKKTNLENVMKLMEVQVQALEDLPFWGQKIDRDFVFKMSESHQVASENAKKLLFESEEMKSFIDLRIIERASEFANSEIKKPLNCTKLYMKLHPQSDRKMVASYFKKLKELLDNKQVFIDGEGILVENKVLTEKIDGSMAQEIFLEFAKHQYNRDIGVEPYPDKVSGGKLIKGEIQKYEPNLNTNGSSEMGRFFYDHCKLPVEYKTEKGFPSLEHDALVRLSELFPAAKAFSDWKDIEKERGTYIKPLINAFESFDKGINPEHGMSSDGICHYKVYLGKTVTGRTSADLIQLIPRKGSVKKFFTSRYENGFIIQNDLSQIELRVFAAISGDEPMRNTYINGEDLHLATTMMLYGSKFEEADKKGKKEMRTAAKKTNFGLAYGTGPKGLMQQIKHDGVELLSLGGYDVDEVYNRTYKMLRISKDDLSKRAIVENKIDEIRIEVAKGILESFFNAHPRITEWISEVHKFVSDYGYYYNPFGRIRRLPNALNPSNKEMYSEALRQAQNFPVQSSASDIAVVSLAAIEQDLYEKGMKAKPCLAVHDMIGIDSPKEEVVEVCKILRYWMNNPKDAIEKVLPGIFDMSWLNVPIESDCELGPSWGEYFPYEDGKLKVKDAEEGADETLWVSVDDFYEWRKSEKEKANSTV